MSENTAAPRPQQGASLDRSAWIEAAFDTLADGGIDAVRVDPLAKALGVTRGSFYWHFRDRADLHLALLAEWRRRASYQVFARIEGTQEPPGKRLERIINLPASGPRATRAANIELAIRLWARRDKDAAKALRHIDRTRIRYFMTLLHQHGVPRAEARTRATVFYAYLLSEAWIQTDGKDALREAASRFLLQL
ncbi:MAG: TetR/AcrR family transcriptional regulator [Hyphomonadaceae bacterium]